MSGSKPYQTGASNYKPVRCHFAISVVPQYHYSYKTLHTQWVFYSNLIAFLLYCMRWPERFSSNNIGLPSDLRLKVRHFFNAVCWLLLQRVKRHCQVVYASVKSVAPFRDFQRKLHYLREVLYGQMCSCTSPFVALHLNCQIQLGLTSHGDTYVFSCVFLTLKITFPMMFLPWFIVKSDDNNIRK